MKSNVTENDKEQAEVFPRLKKLITYNEYLIVVLFTAPNSGVCVYDNSDNSTKWEIGYNRDDFAPDSWVDFDGKVTLEN